MEHLLKRAKEIKDIEYPWNLSVDVSKPHVPLSKERIFVNNTKSIMSFYESYDAVTRNRSETLIKMSSTLQIKTLHINISQL